MLYDQYKWDKNWRCSIRTISWLDPEATRLLTENLHKPIKSVSLLAPTSVPSAKIVEPVRMWYVCYCSLFT